MSSCFEELTKWISSLLLQVSHSSLSGLRSWKSPAVPSASFSASQFRVFLPPKNKVEVGDTWWVIPSELNIFTGYLPNNRYHPPSPKGKEVSERLLTVWCLIETCNSVLIALLIPLQVLIHSLLSMFHPRPFIKSRFAPQGAVACIRASNDFYYDIVYRWGALQEEAWKTTVELFLLLSHWLQNSAYFTSLLTNIQNIIWILMVMSSLAGSRAFNSKSACRDWSTPVSLLGIFCQSCIIIVC